MYFSTNCTNIRRMGHASTGFSFCSWGSTLAGASLAWGQPGKEFGGGFQDRFLEVKRNQLGPALGVNQPTVDKLLAIDARYKPLRQQLVTGMKSDMQRLQQLIEPALPAGAGS